ncbi:MAG: hypothetical protein RMK29_06985 [Myxococcales bacterium]|nr:sodium:proton exchanger [Myxococcota bacterium]MDW8281438.1 hypothetical protein [Myxococcales bacterium]
MSSPLPSPSVQQSGLFTPVILGRIGLCVLIGLAACVLRLEDVHLPPLTSLVVFGGGVVTAAFLLAWAAEALQRDVSQGLAMAVLAFIAVLPEYVVDLYFAWTAGQDPTYAQYAAANMTGANRMLIGIGWSVVVLVATFCVRRQGGTGIARDAVVLNRGHSVDLAVLTMATLWSLLMPLAGAIAVWHGVGMLLLFVFYLWRISGRPEEEPELSGVAYALGNLPPLRRKMVVALLLMLSGGVLLCAAKPFAESLIGTGAELGIDRFLLVQWLAPLASEAPELLVATIFAGRGHGSAGLSALLSSKVNQWTLLVGTLPMVYSMSVGRPAALPLDGRQVEELVLTAAQGFLGVAFLGNGQLQRWEAVALLLLFVVQLPFPETGVRYGISVLYVLLSILMLIRDRRHIAAHARAAFLQRQGEDIL